MLIYTWCFTQFIICPIFNEVLLITALKYAGLVDLSTFYFELLLWSFQIVRCMYNEQRVQSPHFNMLFNVKDGINNQYIYFSPVKPAVSGVLFVGICLITASISMLVIDLFRFSIPFCLSIGRLYISRSLFHLGCPICQHIIFVVFLCCRL